MTPDGQLAAALASIDPLEAALRVARVLRSEGYTREQVRGVFDRARARHERDADESVYDSILDVMDRIVGHCRTGLALFPESNSGS